MKTKLTPISEVEWLVLLAKDMNNLLEKRLYWIAYPLPRNIKYKNLISIEMAIKPHFKTVKRLINHWNLFAKANGIKKWRLVE